MLDQIKVDQPKWKELTTESDIFAFASEVGYPVSYSLIPFFPFYKYPNKKQNIISIRLLFDEIYLNLIN